MKNVGKTKNKNPPTLKKKPGFIFIFIFFLKELERYS